MNRLNFLKTLFGGLTLPLFGFLKNSENPITTYNFNEMFWQPYNNDRLYYPIVNSPFYKHIENLAKPSIVEGNVTYLGVHSIRIPIKEEYTHDELMTLFLYFDPKYNNRKFTTQQNVIFRMFKENNGEDLMLDIFIKYGF